MAGMEARPGEVAVRVSIVDTKGEMRSRVVFMRAVASELTDMARMLAAEGYTGITFGLVRP